MVTRLTRHTLALIAGATAVTAALATQPLAAQGTNFGGSWQVNREKSSALASAGAQMGGGVSRGGGGGGIMSFNGGSGAAPAPYVITQTAAAVTITHDLADGTAQTFVYKLDGSASTNVNGRSTQVTKSHWEGSKLVTVGTATATSENGDVHTTLKETRWIEADGTMRVDMERTVNGNGPITSRQAFDKTK